VFENARAEFLSQSAAGCRDGPLLFTGPEFHLQISEAAMSFPRPGPQPVSH
jgi:hypothetical protein